MNESVSAGRAEPSFTHSTIAIPVIVPIETILKCRNRQVRQPVRDETQMILSKKFEKLFEAGINVSNAVVDLQLLINDPACTSKRVNALLPQIPLYDFCEAEIQLHLQPSACDCCCNLKLDEFLRRCALLCKRYDVKLSKPQTLAEYMNVPLQQAIEFSDTVSLSDASLRATTNTDDDDYKRTSKIRIFFENTGVWYDYKCRLLKSIIDIPIPNTVATLSVSLETKRKRVSEANDDDAAVLRETLARCENASIALNRFLHPLDERLSLTYRESSANDISYICLEYEITSETDDNTRSTRILDWALVREIMSLFPHNCWSFSYRNERARVGEVQFQHQFRQRVYTACPPPEAFTVISEEGECFISVDSNTRQTSLDSCATNRVKDEMYAVKWDGTQHVLQFAYRWTSPSFMQLHILPSNNIAGFQVDSIRVYRDDDCSSKCPKQCIRAKEAYSLNDYFFLVEVVETEEKNESSSSSQKTAVDNVEKQLKEKRIDADTDSTRYHVIIVDVVNKLLQRYPFNERQRVLHSVFNKNFLTLLNDACEAQHVKILFALQRWTDRVTAAKGVREESMPLPSDGQLIYIPRLDAVFKRKQFQTVDLTCATNGVLHTVEGVIVAKLSKKQAESRPHVIEYAIIATSTRISRTTEKKPTVTKYEKCVSISLRYRRIRRDRVVANSYVEFCDAVKAAVLTSLTCSEIM